jgi:hypothetical protein
MARAPYLSWGIAPRSRYNTRLYAVVLFVLAKGHVDAESILDKSHHAPIARLVFFVTISSGPNGRLRAVAFAGADLCRKRLHPDFS